LVNYVLKKNKYLQKKYLYIYIKTNMSKAYHTCAKATPSCSGLNKGIKGYHECAKKKNCRSEDRAKREAQLGLKNNINNLLLQQKKDTLKTTKKAPSKTTYKEMLLKKPAVKKPVVKRLPTQKSKITPEMLLEKKNSLQMMKKSAFFVTPEMLLRQKGALKGSEQDQIEDQTYLINLLNEKIMSLPEMKKKFKTKRSMLNHLKDIKTKYNKLIKGDKRLVETVNKFSEYFQKEIKDYMGAQNLILANLRRRTLQVKQLNVTVEKSIM